MCDGHVSFIVSQSSAGVVSKSCSVVNGAMTVTYVRQVSTATNAISMTGNTAIAWAYGDGNVLDMHADAQVRMGRATTQH